MHLIYSYGANDNASGTVIMGTAEADSIENYGDSVTINDGGKITFKNVSDTTEFNINGETYHVSDNALSR